MATKFSIVIKVKDGVVADSQIVVRKDAQKAIDTFKKWRDEGEECYLFNAPEADKRAKGASVAPAVVAQPTFAESVKNRMKKVKEVADNLSL